EMNMIPEGRLGGDIEYGIQKGASCFFMGGTFLRENTMGMEDLMKLGLGIFKKVFIHLKRIQKSDTLRIRHGINFECQYVIDSGKGRTLAPAWEFSRPRKI
ncbi:hypothetical protein ACJX0J_006209, partial [Zea mays]